MDTTLSTTPNGQATIMQRAALIATLVAALALSLGAGFWLGFREGWNLALMADSARTGFVAVPRLVATQTGHGAELNRAFELDVDNGLIWAHHFLESPLHGYLEPVWGINGYPNDLWSWKLSAREIRSRAVEARAHYARCDLCAHDCRVDRTHGPAGVCQEGDGLFLAGDQRGIDQESFGRSREDGDLQRGGESGQHGCPFEV